jgi:TrmH family RNA methyltransferase
VVVELFGTARRGGPGTADLAGAISPVTDEELAAPRRDRLSTGSGRGERAGRRACSRPRLAKRPRLVAAAVDVRDPGNAGTILRTADAAGAGAVVFAGEAVDPYNGKCVRASAGSLFHVDVVRERAPDAVIAALRGAGIQVLAATGHGDDNLDDLLDAGILSGPTAWLFGSEAHGLPADLLTAADRRVRVPIYGGAESLNLAAAAAVCLYASARAMR